MILFSLLRSNPFFLRILMARSCCPAWKHALILHLHLFFLFSIIWILIEFISLFCINTSLGSFLGYFSSIRSFLVLLVSLLPSCFPCASRVFLSLALSAVVTPLFPCFTVVSLTLDLPFFPLRVCAFLLCASSQYSHYLDINFV